MTTIDQILKCIKKSKNIVIVTHENPDGDAVGSSLAMYHALKGLKKNVDIIIPEYAKCFNELPGIDEVIKESDKVYDLAISLDAATDKLLNVWVKYFREADQRIVIDHHSTNTMFGDINYVDLSAPACAQVVYMLIKHYRWKITPEIGTCIMAGIITDTGGFQYSGVSKDTFNIAAELLDVGVNISKVYKKVFDTKTKSSFELRRIAIDRMEFLEDGKIAFTYVTNEDERKVNAGVGDYEGIVSEGRSVEGVEVSIFLHELKDGEFKISLRSNSYVNVSDVCIMFGGGGHIRAAGAKMTADPLVIRDKVVNEVKRQLK
ncbi:MAG: bifunctional oligoribonuclease/PAP phosphatase NrnA [Clostridiales bacterium]|jgi:phosphoesterase recJ domain protein|nr:bifunctional oligoribonuclease/PAP phosphatase NrnA [Clostridiales bacterium]MBB1552628.1 bifunctional oligoribonuclease/PAP phosphatase NrnA [Clostridiales bacterium]MBF0979511.1 bifunctional oligoribonuclease/PAP phosphatase NrnA [Clostridiales bacterium]